MMRPTGRTRAARAARAALVGLSLLATLSLAYAGPVAAAGSQAEPSQESLLTRKVNEYEGQHRLTGGDSAPEAGLLTRKVNEYEGQH
jgi:hypothetical protein